MVVDDTSSAAKPAMTDIDGNRNSPAANSVGVTIHIPELSFQNKLILSDFNLKLEAGKLTCLLGPSGVGKTSILKSIAGILKPHPETIIAATDELPLGGRISYMDQKDLLLPWATVAENLQIAGKLRGKKTEPSRVTSLLKSVGLEQEHDAKPDTLSGGMRQRVALARTLMDDNPILLVDEPFSAVDAITRYRLQELLCALSVGKTVLMITHDPMEALRIGDEIYVLSGDQPKLTHVTAPKSKPPRNLTEEETVSRYNEILSLLGMAEGSLT